MKRAALTIVFNGLHHLKHNNFYSRMAKNFDVWVIVEGASGNGGSTNWCNTQSTDWNLDGHSIDGTLEYLESKSENNSNVILVKRDDDQLWSSKDEQVNAGIAALRKELKECFLWQIDADEQWRLSDLVAAEKELIAKGLNSAKFRADYFIGENFRAIGEWGECRSLGYIRLWKWSGQDFQSHEPPTLKGGNGKCEMLPQRFNHFAWWDERDVLFKGQWYRHHENIHENWLKIVSKPHWTKEDLQPSVNWNKIKSNPEKVVWSIKNLISSGPLSRTKTVIVRSDYAQIFSNFLFDNPRKINQNNEFHSKLKSFFALKNLVEQEKLQTILQLGSNNLSGITSLIVNILVNKDSRKTTFFSCDADSGYFFDNAILYGLYDFFFPYCGDSSELDSFQDIETILSLLKENEYLIEAQIDQNELKDKYKETQKKYKSCYQKESIIPRIKKDSEIGIFDLVILNGSLFSGPCDLDHIWGAKHIVLVGTLSIKNFQNFNRLCSSEEYKLVFNAPREVKGFAIFSKVC